MKFLNNSLINNLRFFIPVIIIFSSLRIFGYVTAFIFYIPYVIEKRKTIIDTIKKSSFTQKQVIIFFTFLIFQIIHGTYFIGDIRIFLFWIPFLLITFAAYFKNTYDLKINNYYEKNYEKIIYKSCVIYFIFYFILNIYAYIKYGAGFYKIQDYLWIGSSGAFSISSILFYVMPKLWENNGFKIFSKYNFFFLFYIFMVNLNMTRLGIIYVSLFMVYLFLKNIKIKQYVNAFLITAITISSYTISYNLVTIFHIKFNPVDYLEYKDLNKNLAYDTLTIFSSQDGRKRTLYKGISKFLDYPRLNKLIGTGWYSSRITTNLDKSDIKPGNLKNKKIVWPPAIVAYVLDTGIIGVILAIYLFLLNIIFIFKSNNELLDRLFLSALLTMAFLNVFIGYPLVNIAYILFLLPGGIINLRSKI